MYSSVKIVQLTNVLIQNSYTLEYLVIKIFQSNTRKPKSFKISYDFHQHC